MLPRVVKTLSGQEIDRHALRANAAAADSSWEVRDLTDEELILTSPIVYGFSFSDKQWCECPYFRFLEIFWRGISPGAESLLSLAFPLYSRVHRRAGGALRVE